MDAGMVLGMVGAVMGMAGGGGQRYNGYAPSYQAYGNYGQYRRYDDPSYGYARQGRPYDVRFRAPRNAYGYPVRTQGSYGYGNQGYGNGYGY